ncbi:MAG TPA: DotA/TraY family protein, partial [Acetobacteraceae bacterium]|nr:DotA/TraY family protein [Acetobacteraceae bacterium]
VTTSPTFEGLGYRISQDLAPVETAAKAFMDTLARVVQTTDSTTTPTAIPPTQGDPKQSTQGANAMTSLSSSIGFSNSLLSTVTNYLLPQTQVWTDPFGGLMGLGQFLVNISLIAYGTASLLASTSITTAGAIWNFLTGNWGAAAAEVAGHALMSFLATPISFGLSIVMIQGIVIAYVLPMIPWVMWMAGVCGWIILVCEAMIAVPLWMLAHMTVGGDGLHGRAIEGWGLLFNVVFRPSLMVIGLFLGYFVFDCMSWLIRESFGIAAGFVLQGGWAVSNLIGLVALLGIFVMTHVTAALMSFRLVALLPHHLPRLVGFAAASRVDTDAFQQQAAMGPGTTIARETRRGVAQGAGAMNDRMKQLRGNGTRAITGPDDGGMDSTLRATTDLDGRGESDV